MDLPGRDQESIGREAAAALSRYVQFDTTNPPGKEMAAACWLKEQIRDRGITSQVTLHEPAPSRGLLVAQISGEEDLRPLVLNHHIDVVPAEAQFWTHPPFSGAIADGHVWGRGTLDTKNLGIIFLLALELLVKEGARFRRPVVFTAVPDEETGGKEGMGWLVSQPGPRLDPQWVWDEGGGGLRDMAGPSLMFGLAVAEKQIQQIRLTARGTPGHGAMPHGDNANVTLIRALDRVLSRPRAVRVNSVTREMLRTIGEGRGFPTSLFLRCLDNPLLLRLASGRLQSISALSVMLRDTVSLTVLRGGYKVNVIPERAEAEIDCRLLPDTDPEEFHAWLRQRLGDEKVSVQVLESSPRTGSSPVTGDFFDAVREAVGEHCPGAGVFPMMVPGATDSRYWRKQGYPAYGFAPVVLGKEDLGRVHGIDERISIDNLVLGVNIARRVIQTLCVEGQKSS